MAEKLKPAEARRIKQTWLDITDAAWIVPVQFLAEFERDGQADALQHISGFIPKLVSPKFEVNPDGTVDPVRKAYVDGLQAAYSLVLSESQRLRAESNRIR